MLSKHSGKRSCEFISNNFLTQIVLVALPSEPPGSKTSCFPITFSTPKYFFRTLFRDPPIAPTGLNRACLPRSSSAWLFLSLHFPGYTTLHLNSLGYPAASSLSLLPSDYQVYLPFAISDQICDPSLSTVKNHVMLMLLYNTTIFLISLQNYFIIFITYVFL